MVQQSYDSAQLNSALMGGNGDYNVQQSQVTGPPKHLQVSTGFETQKIKNANTRRRAGQNDSLKFKF